MRWFSGLVRRRRTYNDADKSLRGNFFHEAVSTGRDEARTGWRGQGLHRASTFICRPFVISHLSCHSSLSLENEETQIPVVLYIVYTTLCIILWNPPRNTWIPRITRTWTYLGAASLGVRFNGIRSNDVSSVALHLHKLS